MSEACDYTCIYADTDYRAYIKSSTNIPSIPVDEETKQKDIEILTKSASFSNLTTMTYD